jgi:hypothetical protein
VFFKMEAGVTRLAIEDMRRSENEIGGLYNLDLRRQQNCPLNFDRAIEPSGRAS